MRSILAGRVTLRPASSTTSLVVFEVDCGVCLEQALPKKSAQTANNAAESFTLKFKELCKCKSPAIPIPGEKGQAAGLQQSWNPCGLNAFPRSVQKLQSLRAGLLA